MYVFLHLIQVLFLSYVRSPGIFLEGNQFPFATFSGLLDESFIFV